MSHAHLHYSSSPLQVGHRNAFAVVVYTKTVTAYGSLPVSVHERTRASSRAT